ncbi:MAG: hypothetical protein J0L51_07755 [Rhizobiales bacterium]|nr:hypothetical protein [Hyphomicrobiales bacterium]
MRHSRITSSAAGAAMLIGTAILAAPAQAQIYVGPFGPRAFAVPLYGYGGGYYAPRERRMHPSVIVEELEDRGFRDLVLVSRKPDVYVIEGMSPRREPVRLIVDAYDGEILERFTRGPVTSALAPLPTPPMRRTTPEAAPKSAPAARVAGPEPAPRAVPAIPTAPARPRVADWAPINSVPVAPLE